MNHSLDIKTDRESQRTRKVSTIVSAESVISQVQKEAPTTISMEALKKAAKEPIHKTFQMQWKDHLLSLVMQGEYSHILESESSDISWKAAIFNLPQGTLKFMLNSQLNTLPTKDNLSRSGKRLSKACTLCGREEYLSHALSSCPYMLEEGRYTWRHYSILSSIDTFIKN